MPQGSLLGRSTVVRGNVRGTGALEIHGRVEGDVTVTGELVIGEDGAVKGDVTGGFVTISGAVQGDVRGSEAVMLESGARVVGDLSAPRIGVATGALVRGIVRTEGEPFPGTARRPAAPVVRGPQTFVSRAPLPEAPPRFEPAEEPPLLEPKPARDAPPPPVVPPLAKGARAKKKKKE
jgi:cytoskeletal protein CcmA (bactofilin family)